MVQQRPLRDMIGELSVVIDQFVPPVKAIVGTQAGTPLSRYRDRLTSLDELTHELQQLGYTGLELARHVYVGILEREQLYLSELRREFLRAYQLQAITEDLLRASLHALGLPPDAIAMEMEIAIVHLAATQAVPPQAPQRFNRLLPK